VFLKFNLHETSFQQVLKSFKYKAATKNILEKTEISASKKWKQFYS
jgi:hypothetical protein